MVFLVFLQRNDGGKVTILSVISFSFLGGYMRINNSICHESGHLKSFRDVGQAAKDCQQNNMCVGIYLKGCDEKERSITCRSLLANPHFSDCVYKKNASIRK